MRIWNVLAFAAGLAATPAAQGIVINEFVAKNVTGIVDEQGEHEDWVELRNPTNAAITVSGMYLTDDAATQPTRWQIPAGVTLQPGATVLIWCDNEPSDGPLHATFKLSNDGEEVALFASDGKTRLDYIKFVKLRTDHSIGRMFDNASLLVSFPDPTPRKANEPAACGIRRYSATEPRLNVMKLKDRGSPKIGTTMTLDVSDAPARVQVQAFASVNAVHFSLPVGPTPPVLLLNASVLLPLVAKTTDALGVAALDVAVPNNVWLVDKKIYVQVWTFSGGQLLASNGAEVRFCR